VRRAITVVTIESVAPAAARWIGLLLACAGVIFAVWAIHSLGIIRFFGGVGDPPFIVRGPYRCVRHPFYLGLLAFLLGLFMATGKALLGAGLGVAIGTTILAVTIEERRSAMRFGEAYGRYRNAVAAFIPCLPRRTNVPTF
jgi:methanethiol S-methyltransferase